MSAWFKFSASNRLPAPHDEVEIEVRIRASAENVAEMAAAEFGMKHHLLLTRKRDTYIPFASL